MAIERERGSRGYFEPRGGWLLAGRCPYAFCARKVFALQAPDGAIGPLLRERTITRRLRRAFAKDLSRAMLVLTLTCAMLAFEIVWAGRALDWSLREEGRSLVLLASIALSAPLVALVRGALAGVEAIVREHPHRARIVREGLHGGLRLITTAATGHVYR